MGSVAFELLYTSDIVGNLPIHIAIKQEEAQISKMFLDFETVQSVDKQLSSNANAEIEEYF